MKKVCFIFGIMCVLFVIGCASKGGGTEDGEAVAYLPRHFEYETLRGSSIATITGLRGDFTKVIIPSKINDKDVTRIGWRAFQGKNITEVVFPESTDRTFGLRINDSAFEGNNITKLTLPVSGRVNIEADAFANNALTEIVIPKGAYIRYRAFADNEITEIIFNGPIRHIGRRAFANNNLTSITLPDFEPSSDDRGWITGLALDAFDDNPIQEPIVVPDTVRYLTIGFITGRIVDDGQNRTITMVSGAPDNNSIIIPNEMNGIPVTRIAANFWAGDAPRSILDKVTREKLDTLVLPENLQVIEPDAFAWRDVTNVRAANEAVLSLWREYSRLQLELDRAAQSAANQAEIDSLRRQIEELERLERQMR